MKKKILLFVSLVVLTFALVGCGNSTDKDFLAKMEESIKYRMETTATENYDRASVVSTELAYVEEFKDAEFKDAELKKIADKYIEGLLIQKESLKKEEIYEYQIEWQKGLVYRYEALKSLYDNYDFLTDDQEFIGTYISQYEDQKALLDAYNAIEEDLTPQFKKAGEKWEYDGYNLTCTFKNNTKYTYSTTYVMKYYDKNKTMYESSEDYIENIKPNTSYVVTFALEDADRCDTFEWANYYDDVKLK